MSTDQKDRIAELLKKKLEELKERDGDLSGRRVFQRRAESSPAGRTDSVVVPPLFGEPFDPSRRLDAVSAGGSAGRSGGRDGEWGTDPVREMDKWRKRYPGRDLVEILSREIGPVREIGGPDLLEVVRRTGLTLSRLDRSEARNGIDESLWLLPGVRERVAGCLCAQGASRIQDLVGHSRFGGPATRILRYLERGDVRRVMSMISDRGGAAHPLNLAVSAWFDPGDFLFLDIETGGLFGGSPIVVVGLAHSDPGGGDDRISVRILAATSPDGECELVRQTVDAIEAHPVLVSFNGRSFDLPYVCQRAAYYGKPAACEPVHLDLLGYSRRLWRGKTTDCRLSTLAREVLDLKRDEDVSGAMVPIFYETYLRDPASNAGLMAAIAIHNGYDMEQTVRLYNEHIRRFSTLSAASTELNDGETS